MNSRKMRGLWASLGATVTAVALTLGGAAGAQAQNQGSSSAPLTSDVVITKLSQPEAVQDYATGAEAEHPAGAYPIADVEFEARLVPGTEQGGANDIRTNAGQQYVSGLDSTTDVDEQLPTDATIAGTTDSNGQINWPDVNSGLYVVTEASTPSGVIPADDFFVSVPLTDPAGSGWLDTIYVYPKNAHINNPEDPNDPNNPNAATKTVSNADALTVGQDATWTISSPIPRLATTPGDFQATDQFVIQDTFTDEPLLVLEDSITVSAPENMQAGEHYTVVVDSADGQTEVVIEFSEQGRDALAAAVNADANARVSVNITTTVQASGAIMNTAQIIPHSSQANDPVEVSANIAYGGYQFDKVSSATGDGLQGAEFRVYDNLEDAQNGAENYLKPSGSNDGTWTSDENGQVTIDGLRYSNFADGQEIEGGEQYQTYYLVEVTAPAGHQISGDIVEFEVTDAMVVGDDVVNVPTATGGFQLPLTGGMGTAMLTILGLAILAAVIVVARRRRANADVTA